MLIVIFFLYLDLKHWPFLDFNTTCFQSEIMRLSFLIFKLCTLDQRPLLDFCWSLVGSTHRKICQAQCTPCPTPCWTQKTTASPSIPTSVSFQARNWTSYFCGQHFPQSAVKSWLTPTAPLSASERARTLLQCVFYIVGYMGICICICCLFSYKCSLSQYIVTYFFF